MNAAIYCRVSTDDQEREGTSLQTQLEACLKHAESKGYDVAYRLREAFSGLSLQRPELDKLRELVRSGQIDTIVIYSLDRLSRDPTHGVILTEEMAKHGVKLEAVSEDVGTSELGKLINYIRGFAAKLEAEKIKERTARGRVARAKEGRVTGGFHICYGYDYLPVAQKGGGRRTINETEAKWVRSIYSWLVDEGLTTGAIRNRLIAMGAPTKSQTLDPKKGKPWCKGAVLAILKNPSYCGRTFALTSVKRKPRRKPESEWIELSADITPAIISQDVYQAAQRQLKANSAKATRNTKREYLLRGHVRCRQCGYAYVGGIVATGRKNPDERYRRVYRCTGQWKEFAARRGTDTCHNGTRRADDLEAKVWAEIERYLSNPALIIGQLQDMRKDADNVGVFEGQLMDVERQLKAVDREQGQLLQWALKGFPEDQVERENRRLNKARETLKAQKADVESQLKASQDASLDIAKLEAAIERMQGGLVGLDYEGRRLFLEALNITVFIDGQNVEVTGAVDVDTHVIATTPLEVHGHNNKVPFSFKMTPVMVK